MAIIKRLSRLFQADFHAVLDRIEEPSALLKQAVREMEEQLLLEEQNIKQQELEIKTIQERVSVLEESISETDKQLDLCFSAGNDVLARSLVKRKLEAEKLIKNSNRKRENIESSLIEHKAQFAEHESMYESMRMKAGLLVDDESPCDVRFPDEFGRTTDTEITDEEVDLALLQEKQRRTDSRKRTA